MFLGVYFLFFRMMCLFVLEFEFFLVSYLSFLLKKKGYQIVLLVRKRQIHIVCDPLLLYGVFYGSILELIETYLWRWFVDKQLI